MCGYRAVPEDESTCFFNFVCLFGYGFLVVDRCVCVCVCVSVCLFVFLSQLGTFCPQLGTFMDHAKMAEPLHMQFAD